MLSTASGTAMTLFCCPPTASVPRMIISAIIVAAGSSDCELISDGGLVQPVNAWSSLAFSVVGIALVMMSRRVRGPERWFRIAVGSLLVLTGLGSFAFHGADGAWTQFSHDATFLATLLVIGVANLVAKRSARMVAGLSLTGVVAITLLLAITPASTNTIMVLLVGVVLLGAGLALRNGTYDRSLLIASGIVLVLAIGAFLAGRTDGIWCSPASLFQAHALWHILSATGLGFFVVATTQVRDWPQTKGAPA